jgi:hypothetical protein
MAGFRDFVAPWGGATDPGFATSMGNTLMSAPGQFANTYGQMYDSFNKGYGTYNQGLASLGNSYAQNYGSMAGGIGQLANALGNTWNNAQSNNPYASSAEAARQMAVANLGTAAMSNYGNIGVAGMDAWAKNQNGYQNALAGMTTANQTALGGLGQARLGALSNLGGSAAKYGIGEAVAGAMPGLLSEGGYSGPTSVGGGGSGWGVLNGLRGDINGDQGAAQLQAGYTQGLDALNADQAIARNYPRQQIDTSYGHLMNMNRMNLDETRRGMDQFYENYGPYQNNRPRDGQTIPTGTLLDALAGGYSDSARRIGGAQADMRSGWSDAGAAYGAGRSDVSGMWDRSMGNMGVFDSPAQTQQRQWAMEDEAKARRQQQFTDQLLAQPMAPTIAALYRRADPQNLAYASPRTGGWRDA